MRRIIQSKQGLTIGVNVALAMLAHCRPGFAGTPMEGTAKTSSSGRAKKVAAQQLAEELFHSIRARGEALLHKSETTWGSLVFAAGSEKVTGTPMSYDEVRLWLQSYNAGPYACLKYKGTVPYAETRNYVPRIMKYYQRDLTNTPYDALIVEKAVKYGLDPQLIRAIMKTESDFDKGTVSNAGARGLMQVMPCVWQDVLKRYRFKWNYDTDVFDPEKNIEVACAYLAWLRYDFLPGHFEEFPKNPESPAIVKRDKRRIRQERISARDQIMISQKSSRKKDTIAPGA